MKSLTPRKDPRVFYEELMCACYEDVAGAFPAQYQAEHVRDRQAMLSRLKHEGLSFLTKTLPALAKSIDLALATGSVLQVPNFKRRKGSKLPSFLGWLIGQVFSTEGIELADANPIALRYLRQFLYLFYKLELPYEDETIESTLDSFVNTDSSLGSLEFRKGHPMVRTLKIARGLIHRVLGNSNPYDIIPRHGPGSVATGEKPFEKIRFKNLHSHALSVYPWDTHFCFSLTHVADMLGELSKVRVHDSSCAKVVLVPKDSRGPRLISMEPLDIQWLQQGQMDLMVKTISSHRLTSGQVNFLDQDINRNLALHASRLAAGQPGTPGLGREHLVTLDMKDASDRVSLQLVHWLFPSQWVECLEATRSDRTLLPDGRVVTLKKFAPMGSAVCFPVEALIFWALSVAGIYQSRPGSLLANVAKQVWVFGDDIICPEKDYLGVIGTLEQLDLKFNRNKCCTAGSFRESCGLDAYRGVVVTPTRISCCWKPSLGSGTLNSYVAYSNALFEKGFYEAARYLERVIQARRKVPYSRESFGGLTFVRPDRNTIKANAKRRIKVRFNTKLHRLEAFGPKSRPVDLQGPNEGWDFLLYRESCLRRLGVNPPERSIAQMAALPIQERIPSCSRPLPVGYYPNPRRVILTRGWTQIA
jgi:hypothetical protein